MGNIVDVHRCDEPGIGNLPPNDFMLDYQFLPFRKDVGRVWQDAEEGLEFCELLSSPSYC